MLLYLLISCCVLYIEAYYPIPKPFYILQGKNVFSLSQNLQIDNGYPRCNILNDAVKRFNKYLFNSIYINYNGPIAGEVTNIGISINSNCTDDDNTKIWPTENMQESYQINVGKKGISIAAVEVWGVLRALQTLFQMAYRTDSGTLCINETIIYDQPRFSYRGFMLDTSRHFLPVKYILENLELMSISKMNVFHWHIVDDESFPYQSMNFPDLSAKGSYHRYSHVYTQNDVSKILDFARRRGIRVIPEFDSPGHSLSWGKGQSGLLTPCYSGGKPNGNFGPVDPTKNTTYDFLSSLFSEILEVFPDSYVHLGGDEVDFNCWKSNPAVVNFTVKHGFPNDFAKLQSYYMVHLINIVKNLAVQKKSFKTMVWQEVFDNKNEVDQKVTIIHVWKGENNWQTEMAAVTKSNYNAVLSSCWYLNYIHYGIDWQPLYKCDPQNYDGENKNLVIGGEACVWGEYIDATNVIAVSWPRASVVAERLWSNQTETDVNDMSLRLYEFRCRLVNNGFAAETVNGAGNYCNRPGKLK